MKRMFLIASAITALAFSQTVRAADKSSEKEVTITGTGCCAKCELKETSKCQNAIQVEKDGKKTTYYLVDNDVSKKFHKEICQETEKVTATGTVEEKDGKKQFTAKKIAKAKA